MDDFAIAVQAAMRDMGGKGVGQLGEKTLHLALKYYFAPDEDTHEKTVGGFVADAVTEEGVIEIQTRALARLKPKLEAFLPLVPVTVVHPVAAEKTLVRVDENGEVLSKRRSPKKENVFTAMREIYTLRDFLLHENFSLCIVGTELTEYIVQTGKRTREKLDRVPVSLTGMWMLRDPEDYAALLPNDAPETFTVDDLTHLLHCKEMHARMYLSLLQRMGAAEQCGMQGRQKLWKITQAR